MKTYSTQSARQRGDYVIHLRGFPGSYTWLRYSTLRPFEKVSASQVRQRQRVMFYNDALSKSVTASGQVQLLLAQERAMFAVQQWGRAARPSGAITGKSISGCIVDELYSGSEEP